MKTFSAVALACLIASLVFAGQTVHVNVGAGGSFFSPGSVKIEVGDTVQWLWKSNNHTVTSGASCTADNVFCSPNNTNCAAGTTSNSGATYAHTFSQAGTFPYFCFVHCFSGMTGTVTVVPTPSCTPAPSGMVTWFPGDGSSNDAQNGKNGTFTGTPSFTTGRVAQAFNFTGSNYISIPGNATPTGNSARTIDFWFNATPGSVAANHELLFTGVASPGQSLGVDIDDMPTSANGTLRLQVFTNGGDLSILTGVLPGDWTHLAITYDGNVTIKAYINGLLAGTKTLAAPLNTGMGTGFIGHFTNNFVGAIDEVEFFNRVLTVAEIQNIYNAGSAGKCVPALQLIAARSRKTHPGAGTFDVNLPLTGTMHGLECRTGGTNGNHRLVFTFNNVPISGAASVQGGTFTIAGSPTFSGHQMTVNITGVTDAQEIAVKLSGVMDAFGQTLGDTVVTMLVLRGDTTGNSTVNSSDVAQTKAQSGKAVTALNFREDVTVSGDINSSDVALVKSRSGNAIIHPVCWDFRLPCLIGRM